MFQVDRRVLRDPDASQTDVVVHGATQDRRIFAADQTLLPEPGSHVVPTSAPFADQLDAGMEFTNPQLQSSTTK